MRLQHLLSGLMISENGNWPDCPGELRESRKVVVDVVKAFSERTLVFNFSCRKFVNSSLQTSVQLEAELKNFVMVRVRGLVWASQNELHSRKFIVINPVETAVHLTLTAYSIKAM